MLKESLNLKKRFEIVAIITVAVLTLSLIMLAVPEEQNRIEEFKRKAKDILGTDDFVIYFADIMIAKTKDGRQYPSEELVNEYYRNKLLFYVIEIGSAFALVAGISFYFGRKDD